MTVTLLLCLYVHVVPIGKQAFSFCLQLVIISKAHPHFFHEQCRTQLNSESSSYSVISRQIRLFGKGLWPLQSPDLTPVDSLLQDYLENSVYKTSTTSPNKLKDQITSQIAKIDQTMLKHVFVNLVKCLRLCKSVNRGHFQHLL